MLLHPPDAVTASSTHWTVYAHGRKISTKENIEERKISTKPFPPTGPKTLGHCKFEKLPEIYNIRHIHTWRWPCCLSSVDNIQRLPL
jgi:hypothetical protein